MLSFLLELEACRVAHRLSTLLLYNVFSGHYTTITSSSHAVTRKDINVQDAGSILLSSRLMS